MSSLNIGAVVRADRERVYRYITGFGPIGISNQRTFKMKHGQIKESSKNEFITVQGRGDDNVTWRCTFDYPVSRHMEAIDASWSDRTDTFERHGQETLWKITFHTKASGFKVITQWAFFHLISKRRIQAQLILPTLEHFM